MVLFLNRHTIPGNDSPEYNRSAPPALTNFLDHFPPSSFSFKPTAIFTYSIGQIYVSQVQDRSDPSFSCFLIFKKFCKMLGNFFKVHGCPLSILQTAWKFYKIFPCKLPEFFMFCKNNLACIFPCSM